MPSVPSGTRSNARALVRFAAVAALATFAIVFSVSDIVVPWHPYGVLGFVIGQNRTVVFVDPASHVAAAGVRVGDRIVFDTMTPYDRLAFNGNTMFGNIGRRFTLEIESPNEARRSVTVAVDVPKRTIADNVTDIIECSSNFFSIVLAAALVILRPRRFTWAFLLFVVLSLGVAITPMTLGMLPVEFATAVLGSLTRLAWIPLTIFALRFPHDTPGKAAVVFERVLLGSLFIFVPLRLALPIVALSAGAAPAPLVALFPLLAFLEPFGLLLAAGVFFASYRAATPPDRTRMRWVIAGFLTGYSGFVVAGSLVAVVRHFAEVLWIGNLLRAAQIFASIAVTYAIVRHRVLDVRIVVRRAAVYAALTTAVVALIAVFDFLVSKVFAGTKVAALGEIGVAVVLGLALNPVHRRLERAVDAAIFRRRRQGEERLRLVADGLIHANEAANIARLIVRETIEAFGLASVAVFEADDAGHYALADSVGWDAASCPVIDHDSSLVLRLIASGASLRMTQSDVVALPGAPSPALAVPIVFRGELDGFVLFGAHRSGEEIDAEERAALTALARAAASAYDHLDARSMRARLAAFEAAATSVPAELAMAEQRP